MHDAIVSEESLARDTYTPRFGSCTLKFAKSLGHMSSNAEKVDNYMYSPPSPPSTTSHYGPVLLLGGEPEAD